MLLVGYGAPACGGEREQVSIRRPAGASPCVPLYVSARVFPPPPARRAELAANRAVDAPRVPPDWHRNRTTIRASSGRSKCCLGSVDPRNVSIVRSDCEDVSELYLARYASLPAIDSCQHVSSGFGEVVAHRSFGGGKVRRANARQDALMRLDGQM